MHAAAASGPGALLLACARQAVRGEIGGLRCDLAGPALRELLELAELHGMSAMVLRALAPGSLPAESEDALRARQRAGMKRALQLSGELLRLCAALRARGVSVLAYKGPLLALAAYGELGLRAFTDLDLLVSAADVPAARAVLEAEGYALTRPLSRAQERHFRAVDGDYGLYHEERAILVEVHARISSRRFGPTLELAEVLPGARETALGGGTVTTLGDDDQLLVQCLHGAKHHWRRLEWIVALAALLQRGRGDPSAALARADALRARRAFLSGLELAGGLLDAPLPQRVLAAIAGDPHACALAARAAMALFAPQPRDHTRANLRFNLEARQGLAARADYLARWLFSPSPEDWETVPLPDVLFPLYRVIRPARLLLRHGLRRAA